MDITTLLPHRGRPLKLVIAVAAFVSLAAALLWPAATLAAGDTIRVTSDEPMVRFPESVDFNLELDSDAEIVEVRLHYRVVGSPVWTYTYPAFDPSDHVEATARVRTSGAAYLPPNTELEYFYSFSDVDGNMQRTQRSTLLYVDDRFDWQTTDIGPLTLYWHDQPGSRVTRVTEEVEAHLSEVADVLGISPQEGLRGVIYNSFSEARQAFPFQSATLSERQVFQGFAFRDHGVFLGVGLQTSLIVHETAHLLLDQAVTSPRAMIPSWFNEGFASYVEPGSHRAGMATAQGRATAKLPLRYMTSVQGTPGDIHLFYAKAESVVGYLIETHGQERFHQFIDQLNRGARLELALPDVYGFDIDGLEARWLGAGEPGNESDGTPTSPWVYLESTLLGVLVLGVMAIVLTKTLARKLAKRTES